MIATSDATIALSGGCSAQRLFWTALLVATFAPLALVLAPASVGTYLPGTQILVLLTTGHVGASAYFYSDREFRPLIRNNPGPFIIAPAVVCAAFVLVGHLLPNGWAGALIVYMVWQLHHYQRQSYGIVAFACRAGKIRVPAQLSNAITLTAFAGSLGLIGGRITVLWVTGVALYLATLVWIAVLLVRAPEIRRSPTALLATIAAGIFLLPTLIPSRDMIITFWSFAIAHGAQYLIFMAALAGAAPRRYVGLGCLLVAFVLVGLIAQPITQAYWLPINLGLVCSHFLIDAKIWKMRELPQRELIGRRFAPVLGSLRPT